LDPPGLRLEPEPHRELVVEVASAVPVRSHAADVQRVERPAQLQVPGHVLADRQRRVRHHVQRRQRRVPPRPPRRQRGAPRPLSPGKPRLGPPPSPPPRGPPTFWGPTAPPTIGTRPPPGWLISLSGFPSPAPRPAGSGTV